MINKYIEKFNLSEEESIIIKNLIFYHDMNLGNKTNLELIKIINNIGVKNIKMLFELKRADLLAQSKEFHYLIRDICEQEEKILKLSY